MTKFSAPDGTAASLSTSDTMADDRDDVMPSDAALLSRAAKAEDVTAGSSDFARRRERAKQARRERKAAARVLRKERLHQRLMRRRKSTSPIFTPRHRPRPTEAAPHPENAAHNASQSPRKNATPPSSKAEAMGVSTPLPLPYNADMGPVSRGIARFASYALTWLRRSETPTHVVTTPVFGFIHYDVMQQLQEAPILGLTQLLPYRAHMAAQAQDLAEHPPLILIHGLAGAPGNFAPMRVWLSMHRPRPIHVFDYRHYADMFPAAEAFGLWLDDLFSQYAPHVQFEILAHSMGGLITRLALMDDQRAARIAQVLTLGTPHQGTTLARLGGSTYLRQLQVGSPVFDALRAGEQSPLPYALTSVWTERDILVLPSVHATLPGHPSYAMHQSTHLSWLLHPRLIDEVFAILDAQRLAMRTLRMHIEPVDHGAVASSSLPA